MQKLLSVLFSLFLALAPTAAVAQIDSLIYCPGSDEVDSLSRGELRIGVDALAFIRDNEYKSRLAEGYTLPGVSLTPVVSYQPLPQLKVWAGAYLLHFWGANRYPSTTYGNMASITGEARQRAFHCVPVFRVQARVLPQLDLVLGTLYGKSRHRLIEPLYNEEMNLSADPENGVQFLLRTQPVWADLWVNWETFIYKGDNRQEVFTFGLSSRIDALPDNEKVKLYFPLQTLFRHYGGEINTADTLRDIKTWMNASVGVGTDLFLNPARRYGLNVEATYSLFRQNKGSLLPFNNGNGMYVKATARLGDFALSSGYWHCRNFVSLFGNGLFGAIGTTDEKLHTSRFDMLTAHAEYAHSFAPGFAWGIHADVYNQFHLRTYTGETEYSSQRSTFNFAAGIYLRITPSFLIKRF